MEEEYPDICYLIYYYIYYYYYYFKIGQLVLQQNLKWAEKYSAFADLKFWNPELVV